MSLVEATVVLMTLSVLTAIIAPPIRAYVQEAQQAAAKRDVEAIASALTRMLNDVGDAWVLQDATVTTGTADTDITASHASSNRVDLLVSSEGRTPAVSTARSSGTPDWNAATNDGNVQTLDNYLVLNTPGSASGKAYRTATTMNGAGNFDPNSGGEYNAPHAWRGAYLPGPITSDPWGVRYAVNVEYLARALGTGPAGNVNDVIVLSAGVNGTTETRFDLDGATSSSDDVIALVSGGTR